MSRLSALVPAARFPLLALGLASLVAGVWVGLLRFGCDLPAGARTWWRCTAR